MLRFTRFQTFVRTYSCSHLIIGLILNVWFLLICILITTTPGGHSSDSDSALKLKDSSLKKNGFVGRSFSKSENCGGDIFLNNTGRHSRGYISSPGYPNHYPNGADCQWNIIAENNQRIFLSLDEGKLEESKDCTFDYLELFDGNDLTGVSLGRFCGAIDRVSYLLTTNRVSVKFSTDASFVETGFHLSYSLEADHSFEKECNYTVLSRNGTVSSPEFPRNYTDNLDCWILVRIPIPQGRVELQFDILSLENSQGCNNDYVEIFDGFSVGADVLGRFCSKKPENEVHVVSSTQQILIHFHSDKRRTNKGFLLRFSYFEKKNLDGNKRPSIPRCPVTGTRQSGVVTSPNYPKSYPPESKCRLVLETSDTHYFLLTFEDVDIEPDDTCAFDYVEVRDGAFSDAAIVAQICGRKKDTYEVASSGNILYLQFVSDGFMEFRGFKARYRSLHVGATNQVDDIEDLDEEGDLDIEVDDEEDDREATEWLSHQDVHDGMFPSIVAQPHNASVVSGESHILHCVVNGSNSAIVWLKDQSFVSSNTKDVEQNIAILANNSLVISHMTVESEGVFTCVVLSEFGALSFSAWITMDASKTISCNVEFRQRPSDTTLSEGEDTFLTCYAHDSDVFWLRNGKVLEGDKHVYLLTENIVLLRNARVNDSGSYECQAVSRSSGCLKVAEALITVFPLQVVDRVCGQPKRNHSFVIGSRSRVVSGHAVEKGSFPWQAMLWERWAGSFCGGSLLNERWVVTAAHCITEFHQRFYRTLKPEHLLVRLGKHDQTRSEGQEKAMNVAKIIVNPHFNRTTYDRDVALVRLAEAVVFTDYVVPVCLPDTTYLTSSIYEDDNILGAVTGWGIVTERGASPMYLQAVHLPVVRWPICRNSTEYPVTENMFCAGYDSKIMGDACHGDSGGPFTVRYRGRWYLIGLVSWGEGCDREGKYGFYTKISSVVEWIKSVTTYVDRY